MNKKTLFKKKPYFQKKEAIFQKIDLKRAQRTGLSAEGREGQSQEARRAPASPGLLVVNILLT